MHLPLLEHIDITSLSWYHTRARARYYYEIAKKEDVEHLGALYQFTRENHLPFMIIGWGLNCLFAFDTYPWVIVRNALTSWEYDPHSKILEAESWARIWDIAEALESKFHNPLWYRFIGLPGTIGGAVYGNAGCFGLETESNFITGEILDLRSGERKSLSKADMDFSYRSSYLKEMAHDDASFESKNFLISARFDLGRTIEKYPSDADVRLFRETKQPKGNTCGSFFKNPSKESSAGYLIESVGYKWYHLGTASFSDIHANFLMSEENGEWRDLIALIEGVQWKVREAHGIDLVPEVQIIHA
jgi:UDP-N-acetylmuramate dehydrogenase